MPGLSAFDSTGDSVEEGWSRGEDRVELSLSAIRKHLSPSGVVPDSAVRIESGLANTNYRIESDGDLYLLRIYQRDRGSLALEQAVLQAVAEEVPAPRPVWADPQVGLALQTWLPGQLLSTRMDAFPAVSEELGFLLATIAGFRFDRAGFFDMRMEVTQTWPSVYDGLNGYVAECLGAPVLRTRVPLDLVVRIAGVWRTYERALRDATNEPHLAHGDFKPSNLLVADDRISGVLDWEFAHSGTWLMGAGQVLRYLATGREACEDRLAQGLLRGGLEPPAEWRLLARVVDLASLADFLARPGTGERQTADVRILIEESLRVLESPDRPN